MPLNICSQYQAQNMKRTEVKKGVLVTERRNLSWGVSDRALRIISSEANWEPVSRYSNKFVQSSSGRKVLVESVKLVDGVWKRCLDRDNEPIQKLHTLQSLITLEDYTARIRQQQEAYNARIRQQQEAKERQEARTKRAEKLGYRISPGSALEFRISSEDLDRLLTELENLHAKVAQ